MARCAIVLLVLAFVAACETGADTGTSPSGIATATLTTEYFSGTLPVGGQRFYSFTAPDDSSVSVLLANLSDSRSPALASTTVGIGIGIPAGTGCALRESVATPPALTSQFRTWATEGIHCIAIFDAGTLSEPVGFVIRISHF